MKDFKKHLVLYISVVVILISITFTISYAYFAAKINGKGEETKVTAGILDLDFATSSYINLADMLLIDSDEVSAKAPHTDFVVKHKSTSTVSTKYNLYLTELNISDNFKSNYLKWQLIKDGNVLYTGDFKNAVNNEDLLLTTTPQELSITKTAGDSYALRIWLENDPNVNQISLTNGSLTAKVKVVAKTGI